MCPEILGTEMHSYTDPPSKDGVPDIPLSRLKCRIPVQRLKVATISDGRFFIWDIRDGLRSAQKKIRVQGGLTAFAQRNDV